MNGCGGAEIMGEMKLVPENISRWIYGEKKVTGGVIFGSLSIFQICCAPLSWPLQPACMEEKVVLLQVTSSEQGCCSRASGMTLI